ncbi:MAG: thioesterase family protein [Pontixanthobacter sp.]
MIAQPSVTGITSADHASLADVSRFWSMRTRIGFGQCDPAGIMFTPRFFEILNVAYEEWYNKALSLDYYDFIGSRRVGLGYGSIETRFLYPCKMGDEIDVFIEIIKIGNKSYSISTAIFCGSIRIMWSRIAFVTTDLILHKSIGLPDDLRKALLDYQISCERDPAKA